MPRQGQPYRRVEDAAAAALEVIGRQQRAPKAEFMGLLVRDPETGNVFRTDLQSQGNRDASTWRGKPGGDIVGVVHNHPDNSPHRGFSDQDIRIAEQFGVPSFILEMDGGTSRRFRPGETMTRRQGGAMKDINAPEVSPGEPFLAQIPIEEIKRRMMVDILKRGPDDPRGLRRGLLEPRGQGASNGLGLLDPKFSQR